MNKGQTHSAETRKKISEKTRLAVKNLTPNKTAFKKGHQPWNTGLKGVLGANSGSFKPVAIGTITTRKNNGYEYQYIKTESGWERYWPNGKPEKKIIIKPIRGPKIKPVKIAAAPKKEKVIIEKVAAPKPIVKTKEQLAAEKKLQQQKDFLAQFGITGSMISVPIRRTTQ